MKPKRSMWRASAASGNSNGGVAAVAVVQAQAREVRDDDVAGQLAVRNAGEVVGGLHESGVQILAGALVLGQ